MITQGIKLEQLLTDFLSIKTGRANGLSQTRSFGELFKKQLQDPKQNKTLLQSSFFNNVNSTSGKDFLESIKKYLQALGLKLDHVYADKNSLAGLQKILLNHGFEQEEIKSIFDQLPTTLEGKKIKLSELFAKLAPLREQKEDESTILMPSSAVPFFQAILPVLGLDEQTVDSALSYSKTQGGNINMERLISFLKGIGPVTGDSDAPKQLPDNLSQIMKGLGIPTSADQEKQLTLPQFVSRLEMMVYESSGKVLSGNHQKKDLLEFFNSLQVNQIFTENNMLTEKLTRLKSTNPLESSKIEPHGKQSPFSNNPSIKPISNNSERSGQNLYHAMNHENGFTGKDIQSLVGESPDKTGGNSLKPAMQELLEQTIHKRNVKQEADSRLQNGQSIDIKRENFSVAGGKMNPDKPLPTYVLNQVSKQIVRSFQDGLSEIRLQLKPPHLGRLQIHMKTINNGLKVSIIAENSTTQKLLKTHAAELKAALLEQGIRLEKIDVEISFSFDQSMSHAKQDSRKSFHNREQVFSLDSLSESISAQSIGNQNPLIWNTHGALDLIA